MTVPLFREKKKRVFHSTKFNVYINLDNRERARARDKYKLRPIWLEEKRENYIAAVKNEKY